MGSKKKKSKAALINTTENPMPDINDDELLDDLMAQIDRGNTSQQVAAMVIQDVQSNKADKIKASFAKKDGRACFEARKLHRAAEQAARYTNDDKEADAWLEMEAKQEEKIMQFVTI